MLPAARNASTVATSTEKMVAASASCRVSPDQRQLDIQTVTPVGQRALGAPVGEQQRPMQRRNGFGQVVEEVRNRHPDGVQVELGKVAGAQVQHHQPERPQQRFALCLLRIRW